MYASTSRLPPSTQFIGAVAEYLTVAMMDPSIPIVLAQWEYFATTISRFPNLKIVDLTFWLPVTTAPGPDMFLIAIQRLERWFADISASSGVDWRLHTSRSF